MATNISEAVSDVVKWLSKAVDTVVDLIKAGDTEGAALLLADIKDVVTSYLNVASNFIPSGTIEPIPGNFWKKLSWLGKYFNWIQVIATLTTGVNPFDEAKIKARAVATKWGFATPKA